MHILTKLKELGITEKEGKIYTYLLKVIEAPVYNIAKDTEIPRTTAYASLESLKKQGLVSSFRKNNVLHYTPENPNKILAILKHKEEIAAELIPSLQLLSLGNHIKPSVKMFTGKKGMKLALEDILETLKKTGEKSLLAASYPDVMDALPKYYHEWVKQREKLGVATKMIVPESARNRKKFYEGHNREVRFMPEPYLFQCSMDIYSNKVVFFSLKEGTIYSIILESSTISDAFLRFFLFAFDHL